MTDLSADAKIRILGKGYTQKFLLDSGVAQTIYKGTPMMIDQNVGQPLARLFNTGVTVVAADIALGIAAEGAVVNLSDPETKSIEIYVWPTIIGFPTSVFAVADYGDKVFMTTSDTFVKVASASGNLELGTLFKIEDDFMYIRLATPFVCVNSA